MGFELNPQGLCVSNSNIEGKHCIVCCYMNDNKISHVDPTVTYKVIDTIEGRFGKMSHTRGVEHKFLGMNIKFKGKN